MDYEFILVSQSNRITAITLNRPDKCNALHAPLITELTHALKKMAQDDTRVLLIHGNGPHFCAGGDVAWMQKIAVNDDDKNYDDAQLLADLLYQLYSFPKPTIVLTHGTTMGGGLGLVAAADIAIATQDANFSLPEVKIGLTPSMISPYVIAAIGERAAHYYFLTGEKFGAKIAQQLGLIHAVTTNDELMQAGLMLAENLLENSPQALTQAKQLIRFVAKEAITAQIAQKTAEHLAELRATPEAQEGLKAFLEKRTPAWR